MSHKRGRKWVVYSTSARSFTPRSHMGSKIVEQRRLSSYVGTVWSPLLPTTLLFRSEMLSPFSDAAHNPLVGLKLTYWR